MSYSNEFHFSLSPEEMWESICRSDRFEHWWPWFRASNLEGDGIETGSVIEFQIVSPLPHDMTVRADIVDADQPHSLSAAISGDLVGEARLRFAPSAGGTKAEASWDLEVQHAALRVLARTTGPLLQKSHDWAVRVAVDGFRHHLRESAA